MQTQTTNGIKITVVTAYHVGYSAPVMGKVFFSYKIRIENLNSFPVRLLSRYWLIEDSDGLKREVEGEGVIGKQPYLESGELHEYVSGCPLRTGMGRMGGYYIMRNESNGTQFKAEVPRFSMMAPFKHN